MEKKQVVSRPPDHCTGLFIHSSLKMRYIRSSERCTHDWLVIEIGTQRLDCCDDVQVLPRSIDDLIRSCAFPFRHTSRCSSLSSYSTPSKSEGSLDSFSDSERSSSSLISDGAGSWKGCEALVNRADAMMESIRRQPMQHSEDGMHELDFSVTESPIHCQSTRGDFQNRMQSISMIAMSAILRRVCLWER
jgi:hypothetical protein